MRHKLLVHLCSAFYSEVMQRAINIEQFAKRCEAAAICRPGTQVARASPININKLKVEY
jgi:hypothetical protein